MSLQVWRLDGNETCRFPTIPPPAAEPTASPPYTAVVAGVIFLIVLAVGVGALIWWGSSLPRTRPRPDSRYRGRTYLEVDRKVKRNKPRD